MTLGHIQNFIPFSLSGIIDTFFLSKLGKTEDGNFNTIVGFWLNKGQKTPLKHFFASPPPRTCYSWVWNTLQSHNAVREHNRSKTEELRDKVSFAQVFCKTSGSQWAVSVTKISACVIILELPLYYQLHHTDISIYESLQKQKKTRKA